MSTKSKQKEIPTDGLPIESFASMSDFEMFLEQNHAKLPGMHLKLAKKASGIPSISAAEAVEVALCFGWIDGKANGLDDRFWLVRYTPRRAKSIWSQKNVTTATRLIEEGRMRGPGREAVEAAKKDGRWDRAYAGPATILVPYDLIESLDNMPTAKSYFESLNKSQRYSVLWRIETASPQNRSKRIDALVQMMAVGKLPGSTAPSEVDPKETKPIENKVDKRKGAKKVPSKGKDR